MATTKQDRKDKRKRERMQHVLDYHNKRYGTHITIKGKTQDVHPDLKGKSDWDWVCYDTETGEEAAIEVKQITREDVEAKAQGIYNLLHEVRISLSDELVGGFLLSVNLDDDYDFPFKKQPKNRQVFKDALSKAIREASQRLDVRETKDIKPQISERLPFKLPNIMFFDLSKVNDEDNILVLNTMIGGFCPIGFDKVELEKFEPLISHANGQLKKANVKETFLVLIEEGYRPTDPPEIAEAFKNINSASYSKIRHVYFVRGKEVAEIPLPTP